ncbi:MAG TPA: NHL repeat-containing protein [Candidatus Dojkabacteria bacterium]|nr:NHL repeat-containing protein [Candidatus Dojkabacteria bacterium]
MKISIIKSLAAFLFLSALAFFALPSKSFAAFNTDGILPEDYINIGIPQDLVVLDDGDIWYVDAQGFRLVKINQSGVIERVVGREGNDDGEFECPISGLTVDSDGFLYVLSACKVYVLDSNGGMIDRWGQSGEEQPWYFLNPRGIMYDPISDSLYITDEARDRVMNFSKDGDINFYFGTSGSGASQIDGPVGFDIDSEGNLYIADGENHRVQVFTSNGVHVNTIGSSSIFEFVKDVEILSNGHIAVSSQNNQKIYIFDVDENILETWGEYGEDEDQFHSPHYLASDSSSNIYVADWGLKSLMKFTESGTNLWTFRNAGNSNGLFNSPEGVAYDSNNNMYVLDGGAFNPRIQKFTLNGTFIEVFAVVDDIGLSAYHIHVDANDRVYVTHGSGVVVFNTDGTVHLNIGSFGTGNGEFNNARGVYTDSLGNIYVADFYNARVQKFDSSGTYVTQWGSYGTLPGEFDSPETIYIDSLDNIYVVDNHNIYGELDRNTRIQIFDTDGTLIDTFGQFGEEVGDFSERLGGVLVDPDGNIWVIDRDRNKVMIFNSSYELIGSFGEYGGGSNQFDQPTGIAISPDDDYITIADHLNHRILGVGEGVRIFNLTPSADVIRDDLGESLVTEYYDPNEEGIDSLDSEMYFGDYIVSDFTVDLSEDRDWSAVNAITLPTLSVALLENLNPESAPGVSATHSIYVPKKEGQLGVYVCPEALDVADIYVGCPSGYALYDGDAGLETVEVNLEFYWKVSNLTGTGAMGIEEVVSFLVEPSSTEVEVGESFSLTVTAVDGDERLVGLYDGSIEITSTGFGVSTLYDFETADFGSRTFASMFSFDEAGTYTIRVEDVDNEEVWGESVSITVVEPEPVDEGSDDNEEENGGDSDTPTVPVIDRVNSWGNEGDFDDIIDEILNPDDGDDGDSDSDSGNGNSNGDNGSESVDDEKEEKGEKDAEFNWYSFLGYSAGVLFLIWILLLLFRKRDSEGYSEAS